MGGVGALRTGGDGPKGARASARRGGTMVTTRRHVQVDAIQTRRRSRMPAITRSQPESQPDRPNLIMLCEQGEALAEGDSEANGDCARCAFPRRKDYKHTCSRAYGRGRIARPVMPNERGSRAGTVLTIGFNGERPPQRRARASRTHASDRLRLPRCAFGRCVAAAGASRACTFTVKPY